MRRSEWQLQLRLVKLVRLQLRLVRLVKLQQRFVERGRHERDRDVRLNGTRSPRLRTGQDRHGYKLHVGRTRLYNASTTMTSAWTKVGMIDVVVREEMQDGRVLIDEQIVIVRNIDHRRGRPQRGLGHYGEQEQRVLRMQERV